MAAITNKQTDIFLTVRTITFNLGYEQVTVRNMVPLFLKNLEFLNKDVAEKTAKSVSKFYETQNPFSKADDLNKIFWMNDMISTLGKYLAGNSSVIRWDALGTRLLLDFVGLSETNSETFAKELASKCYDPSGVVTFRPKPGIGKQEGKE